MKKGIIVVACCAVLLIVVIIGAIAGAIFFLPKLLNNPDTAWDKAYESLKEGDYYKYEGAMSMDLEMAAIALPSDKFSMSMSMDIEGEADLKGDKTHVITTTKMQGVSTRSEVYKIGTDTYVSTNGDTFVKTVETNESINIDSTIEDVGAREDYTILDSTEINGEKAYHYELVLSDEDLKDFTDGMSKSIAGSGSDMTIDDITLTGGKMEIWVSQNTNKLLKITMKLDDITMTATTGGIQVTAKISDLEMENLYKEWGVENKIEAPI
jgi:hypothetical protein